MHEEISMTKRRFFLPALAVGLSLVVAGCQDHTTSPDELIAGAPSFSKSGRSKETPVARIVEQVDDFNANLEAAGQSIRLDYPWLFVVGPGTDPFGRLRTDSRWPITSPGYILDESDYTTDAPFADVDAALVAAYDSWTDIASTFIEAVREPDNGGNFDVIDGLFDGTGNCIFLFDLTSPNLDFANGLIFPESDIVVGGWVSPNYFSQCLGSANIIGVTWTFSDVDMNGDNYRDIQYVEQFYNPAFTWTTTNAVYLDVGAPIDIETIAAHENGHAHGLGHFGGPIGRQPFKLKPNLRVFNPEAVMNPFYLGGEKRTPLRTDIAGLRTLYARGQ